MKLTNIQLEKIKVFAYDKHKNLDEWHNWNHIQTTVKLAKYIAKKEKADVDICVIAAYLHDVGQTIQLKGHGDISSKIANKLLKKLKLDKEFINKVKYCIVAHDDHKNKTKTLEAKVLCDADNLQIIGPFGFVRFIFTKYVKMNSTFSKSFNATIKGNNTIFYTNTAKKLSQEPKEFMQKFYQLYDEWDKLTFLKD